MHWVENTLRRTSEHNHRYNYLNYSFFHQKKYLFLSTSNLFWIKTKYCLKDSDVVFPMQSSEFTISVNFGSNSRKKTANKSFIFSFIFPYYHTHWSQILIEQIEDLTQDCVKIPIFSYFQEINRQRASRAGLVGSRRPVHCFKWFSYF